jgi:iron complex outermembrane receptor protein
MKIKLCLCILLLTACNVFAQHTIKIAARSEDNTPLAHATATIQSLNKSAVGDSAGIITIDNIPIGKYKVQITYSGLSQTELSVSVPQMESLLTVTLRESSEEEEEEVVVTATRISRTITNTPTRTEVISGEELAEKANMKPGDIRMLLSESTGIQTQQTSATSFNAGIRIQGLDGRYTQILRDGYPLYSGFSSSLSILQIPPLDLRQVEVIKGSASTLYGGGAIAGIVNLVSKTPREARELSFLANGTSAGGLDLSGFYSERYGSTGLTVFASRNSNKPFDPADIGLTAIPKFERYTINPRLFIYGKRTSADAGISYISEKRLGGSMNYIKSGGSGFFERNNSDRITTQAGVSHAISDSKTLQLKNSYSRFDRVISIPGYTFDALQQSSFTEISLTRKSGKSDWVLGANVLTDDLDEKNQSLDEDRDYHYNTFGVFFQHAFSIGDKFSLESGFRADYTNEYGIEYMPRISAMLKASDKVTLRAGGGLGYKAPTIFTEDAERIQFRNVLPITTATSRNERSVGGSADINFRTYIGEVSVSFNQLFYYTFLGSPLVLTETSSGKIELKNSNGHFDTKGLETNARLVYGDFKLFIGYTYTDANTHFTQEKEWLPLTARHRLNNVLMYEKEERWKIGLEGYYFSRQLLSDGSFGKPYWITGFMVERIWDKISLYVNFENFTDTRQTKFDVIYTGTINDPTFRDIYAPVDGFVVNGGIKVRL